MAVREADTCRSGLGTLLDIPWARAAERRCLKLLMRRQAAFGDGSIHANDFGYETDLPLLLGVQMPPPQASGRAGREGWVR